MHDSPLDEIEAMDEQVRLAGEDEKATMFDPDTHPKPPDKTVEGVTDDVGDPVDIMGDTDTVEDELGMLDEPVESRGFFAPVKSFLGL